MAYRGKKIIVVVPARNEERHVGRVIDTVPAFIDNVIVIDDASDDRTSEIVTTPNRSRVRLLRHDLCRGVGAAIRTGYRHALELNADIAVVMAGDGQMNPDDLPALLEPLITGEADYAKGNRLARPELHRNMPALRRFGNRLLGFLTGVALMKPGISDPQCGYTAITASALRDLLRHPFCNGYGYPNEILAALAGSGKKIADVPVWAVYGDEVSGIRIPLFGIKMIFILGRCLFRKLTGTLLPELQH
jgi:glycosyltransferase involved in cell wall biosynthesis